MLYIRSFEYITTLFSFQRTILEKSNDLSKLSKTIIFVTKIRISILHRKEVIQPHLPVGIPCYDLSPVTDPTFDVSLPCGLG